MEYVQALLFTAARDRGIDHFPKLQKIIWYPIISFFFFQVYNVGFVMLIMKIKGRKGNNLISVTENTNSHFQGDRILFLYFHSFLIFLSFRLSPWWRVGCRRRGTEGLGLRLNKLTSRVFWRAEVSLMQTSNSFFHLAFTARFRVNSSWVGFPVGILSYLHSAKHTCS